MPIYGLIEYSYNYSKILGNLWQHYIDESAAPIENPESFKSNIRIRGKTTVDSNIKKCWNSSALKIFTYFWRTLETPLINCEFNFFLNWSENYILSSVTRKMKLATTDT